MSVIEELRENNPATTVFIIALHDETSDADLAEALEQNPFVTYLGLDVDREQRADWNALLRVIATRANLETVTLVDAVRAERRNAPAALVRSILQAIQQNTAVRRVVLRWLRLPADTISTFLDSATSITSFGLFDCHMEPTEREQGTRSLAAALQRSTNIASLRLARLNDIYTIPILEGLRTNVSLKTFIFSPTSAANISDETSHALQHLLESTTSIQKTEWHDVTFSDERLFRPIAQGIISSECVSELKFEDCQFQGQNCIAQLRSILQNKRNLTSLCLYQCRFQGGQVHDAIISALSRPNSRLQCLEFQSSQSDLKTLFPRIPFEALLRAIEKSKLERFIDWNPSFSAAVADLNTEHPINEN